MWRASEHVGSRGRRRAHRSGHRASTDAPLQHPETGRARRPGVRCGFGHPAPQAPRKPRHRPHERHPAVRSAPPGRGPGRQQRRPPQRRAPRPQHPGASGAVPAAGSDPARRGSGRTRAPARGLPGTGHRRWAGCWCAEHAVLRARVSPPGLGAATVRPSRTTVPASPKSRSSLWTTPVLWRTPSLVRVNLRSRKAG